MGTKVSRLSNSTNSYSPKDGANGDVKQINGANQNGQSKQRKMQNCAFDLFLTGHAASPDGDCHGVRESPTGEYLYRSYDQILSDALALGAYLCSVLGIAKGSFVGTLSTNCTELAILELACYAFGFVIVPLYDTLGEDACAHIVQETGMRTVFCKADKQVKTIGRICEKLGVDCHQFTVLCTDPKADTDSLQIRDFGDCVKQGKDIKMERISAQPDDLAIICYTSGTTGMPKGVMLSNKNLVYGVNLVRDTIAENMYGHPIVMNQSDTFFSYLPMAHILERMCQLFCYCQSVRIGFFSGERPRLMEDLRQCSPTFLIAVPKVICRVYDAAFAAVEGSRLKSGLLSMALRSKTESLKSGEPITNSSIWDRILFRKVQAGLGGRVRFLAIGGAAISADALQFAKAALGCAVVQGFGQSETCGLGLCQRPGDPSPDQTGQPMVGVEVKLADVPEMDYMASDNKGEICIRGASCFSGYFNQPDKTAEVLDSDGWVHTGDIGMKLQDGSFRVIDRAKNLFKLAQGEYVAPEKIELIYCLLPLIDQAFVDGSSERSWLLGVIVPARESVERWTAEHGMGDTDFESACQTEQFKADLLKQIHQLGREKGLMGFELVKDIAIVTEAFTVDNELLTPTLKLKRPQLRAKFAETFNQMYSKLDL